MAQICPLSRSIVPSLPYRASLHVREVVWHLLTVDTYTFKYIFRLREVSARLGWTVFRACRYNTDRSRQAACPLGLFIPTRHSPTPQCTIAVHRYCTRPVPLHLVQKCRFLMCFAENAIFAKERIEAWTLFGPLIAPLIPLDEAIENEVVTFYGQMIQENTM